MKTAQTLLEKAMQPVSGQSLAFFRIGFGLLCFYTVAHNMFVYRQIDTTLAKPLLFKYPHFEWVIWPDAFWATVNFGIMMVSSLLFAAGLLYRAAIATFTASFTYFFLIDYSEYLNHYYLLLLFAFCLCLVSANRAWSFDSVLRRWKDQAIPAWHIWFLCIFTDIVLIWAGLVKITPDWLRLEPLRIWLIAAAENSGHVFGGLVYQDWFIAIGAYGTILIHILGAPLLFFKKTRLPVFVLYCLFHLCNSYTFNIGIFPYMTIFATMLFFSPTWPADILPAGIKNRLKIGAPPTQSAPWNAQRQKSCMAVAAIFLTLMILLPMRPLLYSGPASWNEQGSNFSWRMMLRNKVVTEFHYRLVDADTGESWIVWPQSYMNIFKEAAVPPEYSPYMIRQFALFLEKEALQSGRHRDVKVFAHIKTSLNGRPPQYFIHPDIDLTAAIYADDEGAMVLRLEQPSVTWPRDPVYYRNDWYDTPR